MSIFMLCLEQMLSSLTLTCLVAIALACSTSTRATTSSPRPMAVTYKMVRLWDNWTATHGVMVKDEFTLDNAVTFFQYNYEIRDTLRLLNRRGLMPEVQESFMVILYERHRDDAERSYANAIYANALFGVLKEWVLRDFKETPKQIADITIQSFRH